MRTKRFPVDHSECAPGSLMCRECEEIWNSGLGGRVKIALYDIRRKYGTTIPRGACLECGHKGHEPNGCYGLDFWNDTCQCEMFIPRSEWMYGKRLA